MTLSEARKIFDLGPDEDPRPRLTEFMDARDQVAALVRTTSDETLAERYRHDLEEVEHALAVIQAYLLTAPKSSIPPPISHHENEPENEPEPELQVTPAPAPEVVKIPEKPASPVESATEIKPSVAEKIPEKVTPVTAPVVTAPPASPSLPSVQPSIPPKAIAAAPVSITPPPAEKSRSRKPFFILIFALLLLAASGGGWIYLKYDRAIKQQDLQSRIMILNGQGKALIERHLWQDASNRFAEIEALSPGSVIAAQGRRRIEGALADEQFVGYWTGQAIAELEAGRLDEAVAAVNQVLDKYPREKDATAILERIDAARADQARIATLAAARKALDQRNWSAAIDNARKILIKDDDQDAKSILATATAAQEKAASEQAKAAELLKQAIARDNGQFDQQALDWLREAKSLAPGNSEIAARFEKLSSYTRTLRVPGDFATPQEALANARNRDRIVLGAAVWKGPLVIEAAVELQGAGLAETIIECAPEAGSAITIGPDAKGTHISGITFRHESFVADKERFSVALVRRGSATFTDCHFTKASGHGLTVIEGGQATVSRSRFADNGWNGAAAIGKGSILEVRDSEALDNFEHGIETWEGATATLINNRCEGNSRNGIHTDNGTAAAIIEGNQLIANREFGLVLDSAGSGKITGNTARANLLGGLVIRTAAIKLPVTNNQASLNQGPGLILEKGLAPANYTSNTATQNQGEQILSGTDLTHVAPPPLKADDVPRAKIVPKPKPKKERR
jgi:tetratricopeptide (TPR) repeat protein